MKADLKKMVKKVNDAKHQESNEFDSKIIIETVPDEDNLGGSIEVGSIVDHV